MVFCFWRSSALGGATTYVCYDAYVKRTTIFLPDDLHERLRQEAFQSRISMASLIRSRLEKRPAAKKGSKALTDPLSKVMGICSGPVLSNNIDEDLYGI